MASPISPFQAPPTPPELISLTQEFERRQKDWSVRCVRWVESLIREIARIWSNLRLALNDVNARVDVLDGRVKDIYTFPYQGSLSTGLVALPLRVVAASRLVEVIAALNLPPSGNAVTIAILKNGVSVGQVIISPGQVLGQLVLDLPLLKDTEFLQPEILDVGSGEAGSDLVVQCRAR